MTAAASQPVMPTPPETNQTGRVIRKRNVTSRDRSGCATCRARRLKCDEGKPACKNCLRLQLRCGGYQSRIVFKDQTELLKQKHSGKSASKGNAGTTSNQSVCADDTQLCSSSPVQSAGDAQPESCGPSILSHGVSNNNPTPPVGIGITESNVSGREHHQRIIYEAATSLTLISSSITQPVPETPYYDTFLGDDFDIEGDSNSFLPDETAEAPNLPTSGNPSNEPSPFNSQNHHPETALETPQSCLLISPRDRDAQETKRASIDGPQGSSGLSLAPQGLLESARFPEDMIYYHHLRDSSKSGLLSVLLLHDIFKAEYLDGSFFNAVLALSALNISQSNVAKPFAAKAALHALDHFISALGSVRITDGHGDDGDSSTDSGIPAMHFPSDPKLVTSRLATILFLALFELQRGQMRLWYVHSRAAAAFLSQTINKVRESAVGDSLIRSFSRLVALLDIYDRTFSVRVALPPSEISGSLVNFLITSPHASDRLLALLPRVIELEEEWRSNPQRAAHWQQLADGLLLELKDWRNSLAPSEIPATYYDHFELTELATVSACTPIIPITFPDSHDPTRAATNFIHYLVSLMRVQTRYSRNEKVLPSNAEHMVHLICRLAAGVQYSSCAKIHAYGHGILPALMNAYYLSDNEHAKTWIRNWVSGFPNEREGIWNAKHAQRLIAYIDEEYGRGGPRAGWTIIKVRMVDLDEDGTPTENEPDPDPNKFFVEVYCRHTRGWSIDFVEIP